MMFVWDEPKRLANLAKHEIDFADIGEDFFLSALIGEAKNGRYFAIGELDGVIVVIFAMLGTEGLSIISARPRKPQGKEPSGMTKPKYTQADMDAVSDNPELTAEQIASARPFAEMFPDAAAKMRRARGPQKAPTKVSTTIRLSPEVVAYFKDGGAGWQARIDAALKDWMASH